MRTIADCDEIDDYGSHKERPRNRTAPTVRLSVCQGRHADRPCTFGGSARCRRWCNTCSGVTCLPVGGPGALVQVSPSDVCARAARRRAGAALRRARAAPSRPRGRRGRLSLLQPLLLGFLLRQPLLGPLRLLAALRVLRRLLRLRERTPRDGHAARGRGLRGRLSGRNRGRLRRLVAAAADSARRARDRALSRRPPQCAAEDVVPPGRDLQDSRGA